jgi:hypothetical protein
MHNLPGEQKFPSTSTQLNVYLVEFLLQNIFDFYIRFEQPQPFGLRKWQLKKLNRYVMTAP